MQALLSIDIFFFIDTYQYQQLTKCVDDIFKLEGYYNNWNIITDAFLNT